jgi:nucleotide sugar dehydrogenase
VKICVVAMGKIGLPLAVQFASKGHEVIGVDVNADTVAAVNAGREPFPGETDLQTKLAAAVSAGLMTATTDYTKAVPGADVVVVVVPLFVDGEGKPDFGWMDSATRDIGANLTAGTLISYETTLPVGTTRERWTPMLEAGSGLKEGSDFHVVFSPERVLTGRVFADLRKYPKLIGGLSAAGAKAATEFYEAVLDFDDRPDLDRANGVWDLGSAEASELAKLAETTYRDVNIGLANQFAMFAAGHSIDIFQVIAASNSVHDPLYSDDELAALKLTAYHQGDAVDAAVVQTDHADYKLLRAADLPGIKVLVDGRRVTSPDDWAGVTHRTVGVAVT